jgi:DNA-binding NtrC family response regulator
VAQEVILVADDEPHCLEWLADSLQSKGYATEFYETVNRAYDALSHGVDRALSSI